MGLDPSRSARSPDDCRRRWFDRSYWVKEPPALHAQIALTGPYFFIELIAGVAPPGGDGQSVGFFFDPLTATTEHDTSAHRTVHGVLLPHRRRSIENCPSLSNGSHK